MSQVEMKPYSVSRNKPATNWWAELTLLETLRLKGEHRLTDEEKKKHNKLIGLAGSWVTCACGNQCNVLGRDSIGCPDDYKLRHLGIEFYHHVESFEIKEAVKTLEQIEERSALLIKEKLKDAFPA
jgi:hypothetical protein